MHLADGSPLLLRRQCGQVATSDVARLLVCKPARRGWPMEPIDAATRPHDLLCGDIGYVGGSRLAIRQMHVRRASHEPLGCKHRRRKRQSPLGERDRCSWCNWVARREGARHPVRSSSSDVHAYPADSCEPGEGEVSMSQADPAPRRPSRRRLQWRTRRARGRPAAHGPGRTRKRAAAGGSPVRTIPMSPMRSQTVRRVGDECDRPQRRGFLAAGVGRIDVAAPRLKEQRDCRRHRDRLGACSFRTFS